MESINKKQLEYSYRLYWALYLQRQLFILRCLDFKVLCCLDLVLLESIFIELEIFIFIATIYIYCCLKVMFVSARYKLLYIYINTIYVNKNQHSRSWHLSPSLSLIIHKCGVSLFHGLNVASLTINQIYIKIYKVKIKSHLHQNRSIG